jgi:phenylacetate-coenzyme A ligase PaaK-like adenylate-forming protein
MHVFEELLLAEVVDERGRSVPPWEYGANVLITTLFSRTQPLIRFALDDSVPVSGWQVIHEADDRLTLLVTGVHDDLTDAALQDQVSRS